MGGAVGKAELRELRKRIFRARKVLISVLKEMQGIERLYLKPKDEPRLLILQCWAERHRVPVRYVMSRMISFWREKTKRPGKKSVLGVSLAALTSFKSEEILKSIIEREFPAGENIAAWREGEKRRLLGLDAQRGKVRPLINLKLSDSRILYHYSKQVKRKQDRLDKANASAWRRRRRWRGNPWL